MSFNPDTDIRASHTIRIFGTNKDGDVLQDIWLDLERIDLYYMTSESEGHDQGVFRKLYWLDDPQADDYEIEGNPARTEGTLKICSPDEEDQENPVQWVPVRTIIETEFHETGGSHTERSSTVWNGWRGNRTDGDNEVRLVEARRCFHRDTIIDDEVDAATANDPGLKAYVVSSENYNFKDNTKEEENFIEVQYVSCTFDESTRAEDENKDQLVQTSWKNSHYLNFTDPAKGPANTNHGFDPPWALDPFQAIINVNWKTLYLYVRVGGGNSRAGAGGPNPVSSVSKPTAEITPDEKKSIKELDKYFDPDGNKQNDGHVCMQYMPEQNGHVDFGPPDSTGWSPSIDGPIGLSAQESYDTYFGTGVFSAYVYIFSSIEGECVPRETQTIIASEDQFGELLDGTPVDRHELWYAQLSTVGVNYGSSAGIAKEYLYKIAAGDDLIEIDVSGLISNSESPPYQNGGAQISVSVYSTAREKITELKQLIHYEGDPQEQEDKLTEDDTRQIILDSETQGSFKISVRASDPKNVPQQMDNYGKMYQPYKVFFEPTKDSKDYPPKQPPKQLPLPSKSRAKVRV